MTYKFTFSRGWRKTTYKVVGHNYEPNQDKMVLYFEDGSVQEIKHWKDCEVFLGSDWFAFTKQQMENKVGQNIPTNIGPK